MTNELIQARIAKGILREYCHKNEIEAALGITYLGSNEAYAIQVNLSVPLELPKLIPDEINGVKTVVKIVDKIKKFERRQEDLRDQLICTFMAIEGNTINLKAGRISPEEYIEKTKDFYEEIKDLIALVPKGLPNK